MRDIENPNRKIGDVVVTESGYVCLLVQKDELSKSLEMYDAAICLHPYPGRPMHLTEYKIVSNIKKLLKTDDAIRLAVLEAKNG